MLDTNKLKIIELPNVSDTGLKNITMGVRTIINTQSRGNRFKKYTTKKLDEAWQHTNDFEKFIMMFLSEVKTFSTPQAQMLFTLPYQKETIAYSGYISELQKRYNTKIDSKKLFTTYSENMVYNKLDKLKKKNLIDSIRFRANNIDIDREEAPSLMLVHFFLTEFGTQVLARGTGINKNDIGFVPNYKIYSFNSLLHLSECNDFFISTINAFQDITNNHPEAGILDVVRWDNEKDSTHNFEYNRTDKTVFKPDGHMIIFSSKVGGFVPFYLEHDVGDSTKQKISHKATSYIKFVIYKKEVEGKSFKKPILLFVTTSDSKVRLHEKSITNAVKKEFSKQLDYLNNFGRIAITTSRLIKEYSPTGEIWRLIDLETGEVLPSRYNLLSLTWNKED